MTPSCTESGCSQAGRWLVGERNYCSTHGIAASMRGSVAMRLICPIVEDEPAQAGSVWDQLEAELSSLNEFRGGDFRRLREIALAAINAGREAAR